MTARAAIIAFVLFFLIMSPFFNVLWTVTVLVAGGIAIAVSYKYRLHSSGKVIVSLLLFGLALIAYFTGFLPSPTNSRSIAESRLALVGPALSNTPQTTTLDDLAKWREVFARKCLDIKNRAEAIDRARTVYNDALEYLNSIRGEIDPSMAGPLQSSLDALDSAIKEKYSTFEELRAKQMALFEFLDVQRTESTQVKEQSQTGDFENRFNTDLDRYSFEKVYSKLEGVEKEISTIQLLGVKTETRRKLTLVSDPPRVISEDLVIIDSRDPIAEVYLEEFSLGDLKDVTQEVTLNYPEQGNRIVTFATKIPRSARVDPNTHQLHVTIKITVPLTIVTPPSKRYDVFAPVNPFPFERVFLAWGGSGSPNLRLSVQMPGRSVPYRVSLNETQIKTLELPGNSLFSSQLPIKEPLARGEFDTYEIQTTPLGIQGQWLEMLPKQMRYSFIQSKKDLLYSENLFFFLISLAIASTISLAFKT